MSRIIFNMRFQFWLQLPHRFARVTQWRLDVAEGLLLLLRCVRDYDAVDVGVAEIFMQNLRFRSFAHSDGRLFLKTLQEAMLTSHQAKELAAQIAVDMQEVVGAGGTVFANALPRECVEGAGEGSLPTASRSQVPGFEAAEMRKRQE